MGVDAKGRKYASAGIPGTGLSSRQYIGRNPAAAHSVLTSGEQKDSFGSFGVFLLVLSAAGVGLLAVLAFLAK